MEEAQLDQVCRSRWRLKANTSQPEPVFSLFDKFHLNRSTP